MTAKVVLGYRDYAALPNDGRRYEILDGALSVTPAPSVDHQIVLANLFRILDAHVRARHLGSPVARHDGRRPQRQTRALRPSGCAVLLDRRSRSAHARGVPGGWRRLHPRAARV